MKISNQGKKTRYRSYKNKIYIALDYIAWREDTQGLCVSSAFPKINSKKGAFSASAMSFQAILNFLFRMRGENTNFSWFWLNIGLCDVV